MRMSLGRRTGIGRMNALALPHYSGIVAYAQRTTDRPARRCGELDLRIDSSIPFARVAMARLCELTKDSSVQRATGAKDAVALIAAMPPDIMWRIEDAALSDFFMAYAESLGSVDAASCAAMLPTTSGTPWSQRFMGVATSIDSAMAVRWTSFLEAWVRARVAGATPRREASAAEVSTYLHKYVAHLGGAEREQYRRLGRHEPLTASDQCTLVRGLLVRLGALPPSEGGPLIRALMSGRYPWFTAA
jgi:hypothetical protein